VLDQERGESKGGSSSSGSILRKDFAETTNKEARLRFAQERGKLKVLPQRREGGGCVGGAQLLFEKSSAPSGGRNGIRELPQGCVKSKLKEQNIAPRKSEVVSLNGKYSGGG